MRRLILDAAFVRDKKPQGLNLSVRIFRKRRLHRSATCASGREIYASMISDCMWHWRLGHISHGSSDGTGTVSAVRTVICE